MIVRFICDIFLSFMKFCLKRYCLIAFVQILRQGNYPGDVRMIPASGGCQEADKHSDVSFSFL